MTRMCRLVCLGGLVAAIAMPLQAGDWPQWRGRHRSGVTAEPSGYADGWTPKRLWTREVGAGCTSPVLVDGRVYVMGYHGPRDHRKRAGHDVVYCLDARTGDVAWKQRYLCRYQGRHRNGDTKRYGGPNSTPTVDAETGYLYTLSIDGDLRCWNTREKGRLVWSQNLYDAYKVERRPNVGGGLRDFGYTTTPLLAGETVIVEVGSTRAGTVMAFDKREGARRWASQCKDPGGHSSGPVAMTVEGVPCVVTLTLRRLVVMRIDPGHEGKTVASVDWKTAYGTNIPTPAVVGNRVLVTSAYNVSRTAMFEISTGGAKRLWTSRAHATVSSPLVNNGRVYLVRGACTCLDAATGERLWRGGRFDHGSCLITGDDKLVAFGRRDVALLDATADDYRELARLRGVVGDVCYPHVTLADGILLCKDKSGKLVAFDVGGR
ncbi:MAG: PQQ-binding-like beta-propeller repeat protein [Phycisphaerae bacterium]|nr:PQQ-binding-like beta-propeller repeat protein [Phycisphaerae bacterium]